ncbi:perilipin-2 isoform X1 [Synchiropus splendidus]|uniref:perilipin-2 isoform X1 n=1 Tax=Synchiropus splendidus TaxID=270530 RepID=UPI00237EABC5|nr:perilipin-2 isoform X1 [Synchiropus splendidus]
MSASRVSPPTSVIDRVASLPLVTSTYQLVSTVYSSTKHTHPYIQSVCEAAEQGVWSFTNVARTTATPFIHRFEPQIAVANQMVCRGLDQVEKSLPILQQPPQQIVSSARGLVSNTKHVVTDATVTVSDTLSSLMKRTRGAVHSGMEKTVAAVSGSVSSVLESRVIQLVSSSMDSALITSESLVDQLLPLTEDELAELEDNSISNFDRTQQGYYVRLGCLSTKLRRRATATALDKIQAGKLRSLEFLSELNTTVDMIHPGRPHKRVPLRSAGQEAEVIESRTLALAHSLTQQLQTTCLVVVSGLQGVPRHLQKEVLSVAHSASEVYNSLSKATMFSDLPDNVVNSTKVQFGYMRNSMDHVLEYLVNNTPLNWLVGPFYPRVVREEIPDQAVSRPPTLTTQHQQSSPEIEMDSL